MTRRAFDKIIAAKHKEAQEACDELMTLICADHCKYPHECDGQEALDERCCACLIPVKLRTILDMAESTGKCEAYAAVSADVEDSVADEWFRPYRAGAGCKPCHT